jgi:hypothetical protein
MILFKTKATGPIPGHDDLYKTGITARRSALCVSISWLSWAPQLRYGKGDFAEYNAPMGWGIGFMRPFLRPGFEVFAYDGVALSCIVFGWFRINWSRYATSADYDYNDSSAP